MRGRRDLERVGASVAFSATSFLVIATLAATMDPSRYTAVGLVYLTASVAANVVRYGLFDATLAGHVALATCRRSAHRLVVGSLGVTAAATAVAAAAWGDPLAVAVVIGTGLGVSADQARMVRLCEGRAATVAAVDGVWLAGTAALAAVTGWWGAGPATGAVGGWIAGGAGWTVLALRAGRPAAAQTGERGLLAGTWPMAASGTGPFVGYLLGMAAVAAAGRPSAAALMEIGRVVGMPAVTIYSGLRLAVVAHSAPAVTGVDGSPSVDPGSSGPVPSGLGPGGERSVVALAALALSTIVVAVTTAVVLALPTAAGSALGLARRWWPLIVAAQVARLMVGVVSDAVRPLLGPGAGLRLGLVSLAVGAVVPPGFVLTLGDAGGPLSQLAIALLVGAWIASSVRTSPLAHRRMMRGQAWR